jgi:hypothetical protein
MTDAHGEQDFERGALIRTEALGVKLRDVGLS